jgi:hypothetical protein
MMFMSADQLRKCRRITCLRALHQDVVGAIPRGFLSIQDSLLVSSSWASFDGRRTKR